MALTLAASGAGASVAAANPGPTGDQGLVGACNMVNTNAQFGMLGKAVQGGPGLAGMFNAILITAGVPDGSCPNLS
jgi:hypothetical protein